MILNNYKCEEHGIFESAGPHCPFCGVLSEKVFIKAPAVGHDVRKFTDARIEQLMGEFHLTDVPKQVDARENDSSTRHIRSSGNSDPTPMSRMSIDVSKLGPDLDRSSEPAREALREIQGGGALSPISRDAARYPGQGKRMPPIAVAITDKR